METVSSVPVAQQAVIIMVMSLFSRSSVCFDLCMSQNAPECASEHLKLPKFPGGHAPRHCPSKWKKLCTALHTIHIFIIHLTHANVWESMGKPCSCTQFIKSCIFYSKSRENPYQYCKSRENPYQVLQVTQESISGTTSHMRCV